MRRESQRCNRTRMHVTTRRSSSANASSLKVHVASRSRRTSAVQHYSPLFYRKLSLELSDVNLPDPGCRVNHLLRTLDFKDGGRLPAEASVPLRRALEELLHSATTVQFTLACISTWRQETNRDARPGVSGILFQLRCVCGLSFVRFLAGSLVGLGGFASSLQSRCQFLGGVQTTAQTRAT